MAVDLVSVMMQLPALSPFSTTLQLSPPPSAFGETLERTLRDSGYGLQRVSDDQGPSLHELPPPAGHGAQTA